MRRRKQFGKLLRWRGKRSLGWIPFKKVGIQIHGDGVIYTKQKFRFWKSRELPRDAVIRTGCFTQDRRGRWYVSITFVSEELAGQFKALRAGEPKEVGVDLGIKVLATTSEGEKIERPDLRARHLAKLRRLEKQRRFARRSQSRQKKFAALPKERQLRNLHAKVANQRKDDLHDRDTNAAKNILRMGHHALIHPAA